MGLRLGVSEEELDAIAYIYSEEELQTLEMLRLWRDKRYYGGDAGKTELVQVLKELGEFKALSARKWEELAEWEKLTTSITTPSVR